MNNHGTHSERHARDLANLAAGAALPETTDFVDFVNSGLRAAKSCRTLTRSAILADVAAVLSCSAHELGFLFQENAAAANDTDSLSVPDFRDSLRGLAAE